MISAGRQLFNRHVHSSKSFLRSRMGFLSGFDLVGPVRLGFGTGQPPANSVCVRAILFFRVPSLSRF